MTAGGLRRDLGLISATSVVVGSMIGVGIFLGPTRIANLVETPALVLAVWLVGGLFVFLGALTYAELGSALPQSGGEYAYMREAYGTGLAFATGWSGFFVAKGAFVAALAAGFAEYAGALLGHPLAAPWDRVAALTVIAAIVATNVVGVRHAGRVQVVTATFKVMALALLVIGGLSLLSGRAPDLAAAPRIPERTGLLAAFGLALVPAFFAYDGWSNSTQVAEEVRDPRRNVPRSLILGVLLVIVVYALANLVYLLAIGAAGVSTSRFAAADAVEVLAGPGARVVIVLAILVSIVGTMNGVILTGPRIAFAMARDRLFFRGLAKVHPRFGTPARSIVALGAWSALLVMLPPVGDLPLFETLATYGVFDSFVFYTFGAVAVFVLRWKRPDLPREYRVPGYPVVPALFVLLTTAFLVNTLVQSTAEALMGIAIILVGIPFYFHWRRDALAGAEAERAGEGARPLHPRAVRSVRYVLLPPGGRER